MRPLIDKLSNFLRNTGKIIESIAYICFINFVCISLWNHSWYAPCS